MYKGIVLYDKKDSEYNSWFINKIIAEGEKEGLAIELVLTGDIIKKGQDISLIESNIVKYEIYDFAIMRNRNPYIAALLEQQGLRCFNRSDVVSSGNDKWKMYQLFKDKIPVMHTQRTRLPYPFVLKPRDGHGGKNVYFVDDSSSYERARNNIWGEYLKEYTDNDSDNLTCMEFTDIDELLDKKYIFQMSASDTGRDIRAYVLGGNILTAMERTSATDFRANYSLGGNVREYALTSDELMLVAKAASLIKPDFVGIDLIYNNGTPVVNEIEDAVGTRMLYKYTDIDAVKEYIRYIKDSLQV